MAKNDSKPGTDVAVPLLSSADLELLDLSPEGIEAWLSDIGLTAEDVRFEASSFNVVAKEDLVDVPLVLVQWRHRPSEEYPGTTYVIVHAVRTDTGEKIIFTDSGAGINEQLTVVTSKRQDAGMNELQSRAGLAVVNGLVRSDYGPHLNKQGEEVSGGTTFYLG